METVSVATASKCSCLVEDPQPGGATLSTVLMVLAGGRANDPGNEVPGPPAWATDEIRSYNGRKLGLSLIYVRGMADS